MWYNKVYSNDITWYIHGIYMVCTCDIYIDIYQWFCLCCQLGHLPPLDIDAAGLFSKSERLIQEHVRKYKTGAAELKDLIQQVLHHPDFDPAHVDHDMHERLMKCIEDEDIQVIDLWEQGDGNQEVLLRICCTRDLHSRCSESYLQMSDWQDASTLHSRNTRTQMGNVSWHVMPMVPSRSSWHKYLWERGKFPYQLSFTLTGHLSSEEFLFYQFIVSYRMWYTMLYDKVYYM